MIIYKKATENDIRPALDLALQVLNEFEAADNEPETLIHFNHNIVEENTVIKDWYSSNGFIHTGAKQFEHLPFTVGFMEWRL